MGRADEVVGGVLGAEDEGVGEFVGRGGERW